MATTPQTANDNEIDWIAMSATKFAEALDRLEGRGNKDAAKQRRSNRRAWWH